MSSPRLRPALRRLLVPAVLACGATAVLARDIYVPIKWDDRGVPHVVAATDEQVWFGQGYAVAVDRLAQLHRIRESTYGRLAALLGPVPPPPPDEKSPFDQDKEVLQVGIREAAAQRWAALDDATRSALTSFAAGVNAYLGQLDALADDGPIDDFLAEPLEGVAAAIANGTYPPWTPEDSIAAWIWWIYWFEGGSGTYENDLDCGVTPTPPQPVSEGNTVIVQSDVDAATQQRICQYWSLYDANHDTDCTPACPDPCNLPCMPAPGRAAPPVADADAQERGLPGRRFSDTWVLSGAMAAGDAAVHQASPKVPLMTPSMFHEVHLRQSDPVAGWDARGIQIVGLPGFFVGFSSRVAWGGASLDADTDDLIKLALVSRTQFMLDGMTKPITETMVPVDDGTGSFVQVPIARTEIGPVVDELLPTSLTSGGRRYVLRSADLWHGDERHTVQATIRMAKARDARSFHEASKYWRTPSLHSVFGDADGDIGYQALLAVPTRGDQDAAAGTRIVCDGSTSLNDWRRTVPFDVLPWTVKSDGYLATANNRPTGCWYPIPLLLSSSKGPGTRSVRLWEILEGLDPAYPSVDSVEDLARMSFDAVAIQERTLVEMGVRFRDKPPGEFVLSGPGCSGMEFDLSALALAAVNALDDEWLFQGAPSLLLFPTQPCRNLFLKLAKFTYRITAATPLLLAEYGGGAGGFAAFFQDLIKRDFTMDPLDCGDDRDKQIFLYVRSKLEAAAVANCALPSGTSFPTQAAYFDFTSRIGGSTPTLNPAKDVSAPLIAIDGSTLWEARGRAYSHTVDLEDPALARGLHPWGNHEDPDHPVLGAFYDNGETPVWVDGSLGGGTHFSAQEPMGLAPPASVVVAARRLHAPKVSYYGLDFGGSDPQRALSIGLANPVAVLSPGAVVDVRIAGIPRLADFDLAPPAPEYVVALRADTVKLWQPDATSPVIYLVDPTLTPVASVTTTASSVVLQVQIPPSAVPGDQIALQALLDLNNAASLTSPAGHPLVPDARLSTMGLVLHVVE